MAIDTWKWELAQHLALKGIEQLSAEGYNCIEYTHTSIENSVYDAKKLVPKSVRMQFKIPQRLESNLELIEGEENPDEDGIVPIIYTLKSVIRLEDTGWTPGVWEAIFQRRQEKAKQNPIKGFNYQLFNRHARKDPKIREVFNAAIERGEHFGLMGILKYGQNTEGMLADADGLHYTMPLMLVGGANATERQVMKEFCNQYRLPKN